MLNEEIINDILFNFQQIKKIIDVLENALMDPDESIRVEAHNIACLFIAFMNHFSSQAIAYFSDKKC